MVLSILEIIFMLPLGGMALFYISTNSYILEPSKDNVYVYYILIGLLILINIFVFNSLLINIAIFGLQYLFYKKVQ